MSEQNPRAVIGDKACRCAKCVDLCRHNPGWFTPEEAARAIEAGLAEKMMCDWLDPSSEVGNDERIFVLAAATIYHGGDMAPELDKMLGGGSIFSLMIGPPPYKGRCVFFADERCTIHDSGFKPRQCLEAFACRRQMTTNYEMARLWDNDAARSLVAIWREKVDCPVEESLK